MSVVIITGSTGLVGSEAVNFFCRKGFDVIGIDNNLRKFFFGEDGSTIWIKNKLLKFNKNFKNNNVDIRNFNNLNKIFKKYSKNISLIIHCAAQPSHDYGKNYPIIDFNVNAEGPVTLFERIYIGYSFTPIGSVIGAVWGFVDWGIAGIIFGWLYNKINN